MVCDGCGNQKAYRTFIRWVEVRNEQQDVIRRDKVEVCNECSASEARPSYARDAAGNRVSVPNSELGRFSYAIGQPIVSNRQYADTLRRMGLSQKEA